MRIENRTTTCLLALALLVPLSHARAQVLPQFTPETQAALQAMSGQAGVIFAGHVTRVLRRPGVQGSGGIVEIGFAVDDAIRGVAGGVYTLREWAGLWPAGDQPFLVGQRYLMLLHAADLGGLSSPVGGMDGVIPIRPNSQPQAGSSEISSEDVRWSLDLRWVAARAVQPVSYRVLERPTGLPTVSHPDAQRLVQDQSASSAPAAAQIVPYSVVTAAIRSWSASDYAAR